MPTVKMTFPDEMFAALRRTPDQFAADMRLAAALHWYARGEISQNTAAQIAGMTRLEFIDELARRQSEPFAAQPEETPGPPAPEGEPSPQPVTSPPAHP